MARIGGVYSYEATPRVLRDSSVGHTITKAGHDRAKTMQVFLQIAAIAPDSHDPTTNRGPCQDDGLVMAVLTDPRGRWLR